MANWIEAGATGRGYSDWEAGQAGPQAGQQTVALFLRLSLADVAADQAARLEDWLVSARARALIDGYRLGGEQLFVFDAE